MPIIGTAGHVDHGKSTLVLALTGRDPDRWREEKARGLTIDLGFAWANLGDGVTVGFVDVPGHERFAKNMLAGVGGIDIGMLVIAADEGWMPQTEEHASVLDLLGIEHGVVAVTRCDLVDADTVELAVLEAAERLEGMSAARWPIVAVSAVTGFGLDDLRKTLLAQLEQAGPTPDLGSPRLWVDRSFVIAGAGVVVTGTLVGGGIRSEDQLVLYPAGTAVRIRGIQAHEAAVDRTGPGTRTALNVGGVDRTDVERGALLAAPGSVVVTRRATVLVRPVRTLGELADRGAYHVHIGTAAVPVRLRMLSNRHASITSDQPFPAAMGDRFILRDTGRRMVAGGGRILDPLAATRPEAGDLATLESVLDESADHRAGALLAVHGTLDRGALEAASGGGTPHGAVLTGAVAIHEDAARVLGARVAAEVRRYQEENPSRPGIPRGTLASITGIDPAVADILVARNPDLVDDGATVRTASFTASIADWSEARSALEESLAVPRAGSLPIDRETVHALVRAGRLVRIDDDLVYLPEQLQAIEERMQTIDQPFTVSEFREALGLSRRHAVPLLEWFDRRGTTRRSGDVRTIRPQRGE